MARPAEGVSNSEGMRKDSHPRNQVGLQSFLTKFKERLAAEAVSSFVHSEEGDSPFG